MSSEHRKEPAMGRLQERGRRGARSSQGWGDQMRGLDFTLSKKGSYRRALSKGIAVF